MPTDNMTDALRFAAARCRDCLELGVKMEWVVTPLGLELRANHGADSVTRYLHWDELSEPSTRDSILKKFENAALKGLSS